MNRTQAVGCVACIGLALWTAAPAAAQNSPVNDQIAQHEQKLAEARAAHRSADEGVQLITLGYLYRQAGKMQKALDCLNQALPIEQKAGNQGGQAMAQNILGRVYTDLGDEDKALVQLNQALAVWHSLGLRPAEANALTYLGRVHNNLGQRDDALQVLNQALAIWHDVGNVQSGSKMLSMRDKLRDLSQLRDLKQLNDALPPNLQEAGGRAGEANTLDNLGETYSGMGRPADAFDYFNRALVIWRQVGEHGGEAMTLNNMGRAYADLGEKQRSLEVYNQALALSRTVGNRQDEALTLNNIGRLYRDLGESQTAADYYNQALPIWREIGNRSGEGLALNDIGRAYADLGQPEKALDFSRQALPIWRETGIRRGEAMTLNNMGRDYTDLKDPDKALDYDSQALPIWREVQDRRGEALALMTIGWAYSARKQDNKALASELAALSLAKAAGDPEVQGSIDTTLMIGFRDRHLPEEAIFFGMDAVNNYQQIRKNISAMAKDLQAGFAQSKSNAYRILAELLVETGRLGEAEEILDLLKEQELKDIVRGSGPNAAGPAPQQFTTRQQQVLGQMAELETRALPLNQLTVDSVSLEVQAARTPEQDARLSALGASIEQQTAGLQSFFDSTIAPRLQPEAAAARNQDASAHSYLQETLAKLGPHVLGIRLLLGRDHAYEIVVTATARRRIELAATPAELRSQAFAALKALGLRNADPRPQLAQLYATLVAPLEDDLKALDSAADPSRVPTLLWSLDDALRYLPMAALYDGRQYLVERYDNVLFTPESYGHMVDPPLTGATAPSALAMGLSKSYGGLPPLPGVMPELDAVVHDPAVPESHGPMQGRLLPNDQFTLAALKTELGAGQGFTVVHIASHFVVETGSGDEPYLMLGGADAGDAKGYPWDLSEMENSPVAFRGTRLLTLSACSTGKDYTSRNGLEMDSLGMVAQQKQAEAVLATLWDVNDASTSRLISDFYDRWVKHPAQGKGDALRQAQLAFVHGTAASPGAATDRGLVTVEKSPSAAHPTDYSHPYYWAPFVLIGNYL